MSDLNGELLAAVVAASEERKRDALKVLRGELVATDSAGATEMKGPLLMGMGAAAEYLGVSRPTLWRMIQAGRLEKVQLFPGSNRIRRADLQAVVMRRRPKRKTEVEA